MSRRRIMQSEDEMAIFPPKEYGCYIYFQRKKDGAYCYCPPDKWKSLENRGEKAMGVWAYKPGSYSVMVAPDEKECYWSDNDTEILGQSIGGSTQAGSFRNGKTITAKIIEKQNSVDFAPGWCYAYNRITTDKNQWFLPAGGQLLDVYNNKEEINNSLRVISGATLLSNSYYWTCNEPINYSVAVLDFNTGQFKSVNKKMNGQQCLARPIREFANNYLN